MGFFLGLDIVENQELITKKLIEVATLEIDCKIGKDKHFIAANRKNNLRIILGLFSVIGSAIISSGIGEHLSSLIETLIDSDVPWKQLSKFLGGILPLLVGISTAIIGFLGLEKQTVQHRVVGNSYIEIARKTRSIFNSINANNFDEKNKQFEALIERYFEINIESESCPTNNKDLAMALQMNSRRRDTIKERTVQIDNKVLNINVQHPKKKSSLYFLLKRGLKLKTANFLMKKGVLRRSDYREYLKKI